MCKVNESDVSSFGKGEGNKCSHVWLKGILIGARVLFLNEMNRTDLPYIILGSSNHILNL